MFSSDALRKVLYLENTDQSTSLTSSTGGSKSGLRYTTCYDGPILGSVGFETASAIQPRSAYGFSSLVLGATTVACLAMRARNKEKWWVGLFGVNLVYFNALKAHKVGNGIVGHQSGFFGDCLLMIGFLARAMVRVAPLRHSATWFGVAATLAWYDLGRFHLWSDYVTHLRREITPERSYDLFGQFSPQDIPLEFLQFRKATVKE